jgi:hypothetical protein
MRQNVISVDVYIGITMSLAAVSPTEDTKDINGIVLK